MSKQNHAKMNAQQAQPQERANECDGVFDIDFSISVLTDGEFNVNKIFINTL